jgi:hypothetical protein
MADLSSENFVRDSARERGLDEVAITNSELAAALEGRPLVVRTQRGAEVLLRLATPEELIQHQREAIEATRPEFPGEDPPLMSPEQADLLTRPLDFARIAERMRR